jgi:hypothetical protein
MKKAPPVSYPAGLFICLTQLFHHKHQMLAGGGEHVFSPG